MINEKIKKKSEIKFGIAQGIAQGIPRVFSIRIMDHIILSQLALGKSIIITATGKSMEPRIMEGTQITIEPIDVELSVGDVVFVRIKEKFLEHQIIDIVEGKYVIGNSKNKIDGIVTRDAIYGIIKC